MTTAKIHLSQKEKTVKISKLICDDSLVFEVFDDRLEADREELLRAILHIGALAMLEDRIHHLIDATEKEIFPKLENFKRIFEKNKLAFETTTQKGEKAEVDIVDELNGYIARNGWTDLAASSGTMKGSLKGNKTGDVLCVLDFDRETGEGQTTLGIEVKFDRSVPLGDPTNTDIFKSGDSTSTGLKKSVFDTAWSQLLETRANRECPLSLIVFDKTVAHTTVLKAVEDVTFVPGVPGFLVMIDAQSGDYRNLFIAYRIARTLALYRDQGEDEVDVQILELLVGRIVHFLSSAKKISDSIQKHTTATVKLNKDIQSEMSKLVHMADFTQAYLQKFLEEKTLSAKDLTEFYYAADAKQAWKQDSAALEAEIKKLQG
jgi:hypothetical protein